MACTALNIQSGLFINADPWDTAANKSFDGKNLTLTNSGLTVQQGGNSVFHQKLNNHSLSYKVLGNKYLVILDMEASNVLGTRRVSLVNFQTWTEIPILDVGADSATAPPIVNQSQGNGCVFMVFGQDGTQQTGLSIRRSDDGAVMLSLGGPIIPTGQTLGEATASELIIHYSTGGTSKQSKIPIPVGQSMITPFAPDFPDVPIGGCPVTPPTKQYTITNIGNDCLTVNSIADSPPFSVQSTSQPLPASLAKNQTLDVTIQFAPGATGNWNSVELAVTTTPANGDNKITVSGEGVAAQPGAQFNATSFNFGTHPVGTAAPGKNLVITNNGSAPLVVTVPVLAVSGFACAGFNGTIGCGQAQTIGLGYTPTAEGQQNATLNVTLNTPAGNQAIQLTGVGCIANAAIAVPPTNPINFGQVEQGFRTVKYIEVQNTADATLNFNGAVGGPNAVLFGLPDPGGSVTVTPANRAYSVNPVTACGGGATGTGRTIVAVAFFANAAPGNVSGTLTLTNLNASNFPVGQTWQFALNAEITPPVALDVGLVVDHSGSMTDPLGSRVKMDAALAASQLFAELLRPDLDDRVAVVRFNHLPEAVVSMTPVSSTTAPTQNDILQSIQNNIPPAAGNTAIAAGAASAFTELATPRPTPPPALKRAVVVLSDGKENTAFEDPPGSGQWFSILGGSKSKPLPSTDSVDTDPLNPPSDVDVYTLGLGRTSDINPAELEALATPGDFFHVDGDLSGATYFQLEKYYTQIFMDIVGTSPVLDPVYWIDPGQKHEIEFDVLRGDVNALVIIYDWQGMRLPFYLLSPKGEIVDPAVIPPGYQLRPGATSQARFVEVKMPLKEPDRYAGRWKVIVEHPKRVCVGMPAGGRDKKKKEKPTVGFLPEKCREYPDPIQYGIAIGVGSNFRMMPFVTPGPVYVGEPILLTALISEAGLPVAGCDVSVEATAPGGATWTLKLHDDGAHDDGEPNDGEYAREFTHTQNAGTYHFLFRAKGWSRDGEPVVREAVRDKAVLRWVPEDPPGGGRPGRGDDECCEKLLKEMRAQRKLLERALKGKKGS